MKYFNGFCLDSEETLFFDLLPTDCIAGFSYGAIKAFEYALQTKDSKELILLSPAFFQTQDKKFKKLQTISFRKDPKSYTDNFLKNCAYPSSFDLQQFFKEDTSSDLEKLLHYIWDQKSLNLLKKRGWKISVHLGEEDKICPSTDSYEFFKEFGEVIVHKNKGHCLL